MPASEAFPPSGFTFPITFANLAAALSIPVYEIRWTTFKTAGRGTFANGDIINATTTVYFFW
jgi:hypothetical protein